MIHNWLKPCCDDCDSIDIKTDTSREVFRNVVGEIQKNCDTIICCGHQSVCKRYIECEQQPNKI